MSLWARFKKLVDWISHWFSSGEKRDPVSDPTIFTRSVLDRLSALEVTQFGTASSYSDHTSFEQTVLARLSALEIAKFGHVTVEPDTTSFTVAVLARLSALEGTISGNSFGGAGTLSASTLGFPSPLSSNPTSISIAVPADWQSGDALKLAYSATSSLTSFTVLSHTLADADITAGTVSIGLPTLAGITYFQALGSHSGVDSANLSDIVAWGDTSAPTITTSASQTTYDEVQLAVPLTATDTSGVPNILSTPINGTQSPGWYISGGADQLEYQIAIVAGVPTLQWINNGSESVSTPRDQTLANTYKVNITAVDYSGNASTLSLTTTVNAVTASISPAFTNVSNASLSTVYTSNTVTVTTVPTGISVSASVSGAGFTYSKNGGAFVSAGSFTVQNGDTIALRVTSGAANSITETGVLTIGLSLASQNWNVATPGSAAVLNTTNGINKSSFLTVSGTPALSFSATGGNAQDSVRTTIEQQFDYAQFEVTINSGATANWMVGLDDGTADLSGFRIPGTTTSTGISVEFNTGAFIVIGWNADANQVALVNNVAGTIANGDTFTIVFKKSAGQIEVYRTRSGTTTQMGTTQTGMPTLTHYYGFAASNNSTVSGTMNYGATTYAKTPGTGVAAYWG